MGLLRWFRGREATIWRHAAGASARERDELIAVLWLVRDALAHVTVGGRQLDDGEAREVIDAADEALDRHLPSELT